MKKNNDVLQLLNEFAAIKCNEQRLLCGEALGCTEENIDQFDTVVNTKLPEGL